MQLLADKYLLQNNQFSLQSQMTGLFALLCFVAIFLFYVTGFASTEQLATFNQVYADALFLALIIFAIIMQFRLTSSLVDPIFWLLLGGAFCSWLIVTLIQYFFWQELSQATQYTINNLGYFLFYALSIAAIEVKSYQKANELLSVQSLLIWTSTFTFVLGTFVFLVLTASQQLIIANQQISSFFVFYIFMDIYLALRWLQLAWVCRESLWIGFALFGIGAFNWALADLLEGMHLAGLFEFSAGSWYDWLWYTPYLFIFAATQLKISSAQDQNLSRSFSRTHLLNSPIFFLIASLVLYKIVTSDNSLIPQINQTQETIFNLWLSITLLLAVSQLILLINQFKTSQLQLSEVKSTASAMQQRLLQQAQSLKDQAASNKAILETTDNAIFTLDLKGKILSCNPAASRLLGMEQNALVNANFIDVTHTEGELIRYFTYQSYQRKIDAQDAGIEIEALITDKQGKQIPVHATLSKEQNNSEGLLVVSLVNISEQKQAEQDAHNLKDQFTANISHEFRTPLTIINGVLDNLLSQDDLTVHSEQLESAKRNSMRMIRMVEQLLELSRIANDPLPLAPLNVQPEVNFVCSSFLEIAKNKRIEFEIDISVDAWVEGNSQALEKILFNLLSNAFKYTEQGKVSVKLRQLEDSIQLSVQDTGIGMNEEQLGLIFERFHRVDNQTTQTVHGVGIGLALVKELCEAMRWSIQVSSSLDKGTNFTVAMPRATEPQDPQTFEVSQATQTSIAAELLDTQPQSDKNKQLKSKHSVLIIEDNQDMQSHINDILSPFHQCLIASTGEEGLRLATDYLPDIVVSDVMMPGISGFDVLKSLKSSELTSHIPVILLTARGDSASKIRGLEGEADDYLSKPFDAEELRLRVNNQLNSRQKLQHKLANQWQQNMPTETEPAIEDKFLVRLDNVFEQCYKDCEFSMMDLANEMSMSDRQVQRKVKSLLDISPLEALKQFRLKKAKVLLESGDQIGIVAQSCGFASQSYFGRCFKEKFGLTPKAFQQSLH